MSVSAGAKVQRRTSGLSDKVRKRIEITILSLPALIMFLGFVILPVFMAGYYGFFKWKGYGKPTVNGQFIGFENYKVILTDPNFQQALGHTLFVVVASLVIQGPLAILFALLLNQKFKGRALIRTLIFVPYVVSEVIVGTGWSLILQTTGALNALLKKIGLGGADWISDPKIAIWTLMFIISWKYIGFAVILMIAGMQSIPEDLYEAAKVDGAGFWRQQWSITLPLLGPTFVSGHSCRLSVLFSCSTWSTSSGASTCRLPQERPPWQPTWCAKVDSPTTMVTVPPWPW